MLQYKSTSKTDAVSNPNTPGNDGGCTYEGHPSTIRLRKALDKRFSGSEGLEELKDISRRGLSGGVSGFIYYTELNRFFHEHEAAIEETLQDMGVTLQMLTQNAPNGTFQTIRQNAVWLVVEEYAHLRVNQDLDEPEEEDEPSDQEMLASFGTKWHDGL